MIPGGCQKILKAPSSRQRTLQLVKGLSVEGSGSEQSHDPAYTKSNALEQRAFACALFASAPLESSPYWPVNSAIESFSALHSTTGLPWWGTLVLAAAGVRLTLSPLTVLQLKSLARNRPLLQQALQPSTPQADLTKAIHQKQRSWRQQWELFKQAQAKGHAPSLAWIIAAPLIQLPVFITSILAVRHMSTVPWPGFQTEGIAWFRDLSFPATSFEPLSTPLGSWGIVLPMLVAGLMLANIQQAFGGINKTGRQSASATGRTLGLVRLGMEWLTLPIFLAAIQLPQAVLVYWATSSTCALIQSSCLQTPSMRSYLGLTSLAKPGEAAARMQPQSSADVDEMSVTRVVEAIADDVPRLFLQAAEWRAQGLRSAAVVALKRIVAVEEDNARAHYALGQTLAGLQDWQPATTAYKRAALLEVDPLLLARSLTSAGICAYRAGDIETSMQTLHEGLRMALSILQHTGGTSRHTGWPSEPLYFTRGRLAKLSQLNWQGLPSVQADVTVHAAKALASVLHHRGQSSEAVLLAKSAESLQKGGSQSSYRDLLTLLELLKA